MNTLSSIKLMVLENEPAQLEILEFFLRRIGIANLQTANSYHTAVDLFKSYRPDVALLDIELGEEKTGIDVARFIKSESKTPFLFITSNYTSKMYEMARELGPHAFISRDLNEVGLRQAIELAAQSSSPSTNTTAPATKSPTTGNVDSDFYVKFGSQYKKVSLDEILWVEVDGRYSVIKTTDGKKTLLNTSLRDTSKKLPEDQFCRIHKSFIVNLDRVESVDVSEDVVKIGGETIPIGRNFKKTFLGRMNRF